MAKATWTTDRAMVELRRHVVRAGSQKALAAEIGVSESYLSDVLCGARAPDAIFERIGLQRIVRWARRGMERRMTKEAQALLCLNGWAGYTETPCEVVGETPKRYRIKATQRMKLPGRNRWLYVGETALVPRSAIKFAQRAKV